jgi:hypothetical protein
MVWLYFITLDYPSVALTRQAACVAQVRWTVSASWENILLYWLDYRTAQAGKYSHIHERLDQLKEGNLSNVLDESSLIASILKIWYATPSSSGMESESKFLDVIGTKVLRVFLLAIYSHLY